MEDYRDGVLFLDSDGQGPVTSIAFVGGPRNGHTEPGDGTAAVIHGPAGSYRRSVRCADDGVLRYLWQPAPEPGRRS